MKNLLNSRYYQMVTIMLALMAVLAVRLFVLSVVQNEEWDTYATQIS